MRMEGLFWLLVLESPRFQACRCIVRGGSMWQLTSVYLTVTRGKKRQEGAKSLF